MIPICFLGRSLYCIIIIKYETGMRYYFRFPTENDFLCLFSLDLGWNTFSTERRSYLFLPIFIKLKRRGIAIMDHKKQGLVVSK